MLKSIARTQRRFAQDKRGGAILIFAIMLPIFIVLVLGVVDLYRISTVKQQLQDSLDSATLMVARSDAKTNVAADAMGDAAFENLLEKAGVAAEESTFVLAADNTVNGTARGRLNPLILGLFAGDQLRASVETVVKRATESPVELVLVLDTTGSMDGQPLKDLKVAAKDLVDKMHKELTKPGLLKIAVVPFGQYVNVGVSRRNESWIDVGADYSTPVNPSCYEIKETTTCKNRTVSCTRYNDGKPYASTCNQSYDCVKTKLDTPQKVCPAPYNNNYKFTGCVGSPGYPKNVQDSDPSRVYPGLFNTSCGSEFTPLTNSKSTVDKAIDALKATGYTYIPSGLAWGFNMLSQATPMTDAAPYDPSGENTKPRKALVLMTDGENTKVMNHGNGRHDKDPPAGKAKQANDYTEQLCANIKEQKIEVFTVAFQVTNNEIKEILQDCASDPEHYFDATDAAKLKDAFQQIATSLRNLYIAH